MTTQYKPLTLTQVCEIRDAVERFKTLYTFLSDEPVITRHLVMEWIRHGFDPADVRQAAEEALQNLRNAQ